MSMHTLRSERSQLNTCFSIFNMLLEKKHKNSVSLKCRQIHNIWRFDLKVVFFFLCVYMRMNHKNWNDRRLANVSLSNEYLITIIVCRFVANAYEINTHTETHSTFIFLNIRNENYYFGYGDYGIFIFREMLL